MEKKRIMVNYYGSVHPILRKGYFNNFIGKYIDASLYRALCPFENSVDNIKATIDLADKLKERYNIKDLNDLLNKFGEELVINNVVDIRTILLFVANVTNKDLSRNIYEEKYIIKNCEYIENNDEEGEIISDENLQNFYNKVTDILVEEYDFIAASTLLLSRDYATNSVKGESVKRTKIYKYVLDELEQSNLPVEESIYGLYSCMKYIQRVRELNEKEALIPDELREALFEEAEEIAFNKISNVLSTIDFSAPKNIQDSSLYKMLGDIVNVVSERLVKSKNCEVLMNILTLTRPQIKPSDIEKLCASIGISKLMGAYINCISRYDLDIQCMDLNSVDIYKENIRIIEYLEYLVNQESYVDGFLKELFLDMNIKSQKEDEYSNEMESVEVEDSMEVINDLTCQDDEDEAINEVIVEGEPYNEEINVSEAQEIEVESSKEICTSQVVNINDIKAEINNNISKEGDKEVRYNFSWFEIASTPIKVF